MTEVDILNLISRDRWMLDVLKSVRHLSLPDWHIAAGFVRDKVWDFLHGYEERTPLSDIDVVYFDKEHKHNDTELKKLLEEKHPGQKFEVKNQARAHVENNDEPYHSSEDAMSKWVETATAIGVSLDHNNKLKLTAPHGVKDLINLEVKMTPHFRGKVDLQEHYKKRVEEKKWQEKWPKLKVSYE